LAVRAVMGDSGAVSLCPVCSDMWKPYLNMLAEAAGQALHVLDRSHITMHMSQAVDEVRRAEDRH
jgi:transposase